MSDPEAMLPLNINGEEVIAHRYNSAMFSFMGALSVYNHIFVAEQQTDGCLLGSYLFRDSPIPEDRETYWDAVKFMTSEDFPHHQNLTAAPACDVRAFDNAQYGDIRASDTFPDRWTEKEIDGKGTE